MRAAVLLGFGVVFAQLQGAAAMLLRSSLAKHARVLTTKSLAAEWLQYCFKRFRVIIDRI
jgi:hypothetical protein